MEFRSINADLRADLQLLIDCLKCQPDDPATIKQALVTVATTCNNAGAQDWLRESESLQYIVQLMIETDYSEVRDAAMYCVACAVDRNAHSQKQFGMSSLYAFLRGVLTQHSSTRTRRTAVYLLICLTANNSCGQMLMRKSGCLKQLYALFLDMPWSDVVRRQTDDQQWFKALDGCSVELWTSVVSLICVSINNPQNDENQRAVCSVFPQAVAVLHDIQHPVSIRSICNLLSLAVSGNVHNQDRLLTCGGMEALISALHRCVNRLRDDEAFREPALNITIAIDAVVTGNGAAADQAGILGVVPLLLQLVRLDVHEATMLTQVILTLAHCLDAHEDNQKEFQEYGGMDLFVGYLTNTEDEDVSNAIKYILSTAVKKKPGSRKSAMKSVDELKAKQQLLDTKLCSLMSSSSNLDGMDELQKKIETLAQRLDEASRKFGSMDLNSSVQTLDNTGDQLPPAPSGEPLSKRFRSNSFQDDDAFAAAVKATEMLQDSTDVNRWTCAPPGEKCSRQGSIRPVAEACSVTQKSQKLVCDKDREVTSSELQYHLHANRASGPHGNRNSRQDPIPCAHSRTGHGQGGADVSSIGTITNQVLSGRQPQGSRSHAPCRPSERRDVTASGQMKGCDAAQEDADAGAGDAGVSSMEHSHHHQRHPRRLNRSRCSTEADNRANMGCSQHHQEKAASLNTEQMPLDLSKLSLSTTPDKMLDQVPIDLSNQAPMDLSKQNNKHANSLHTCKGTNIRRDPCITKVNVSACVISQGKDNNCIPNSLNGCDQTSQAINIFNTKTMSSENMQTPVRSQRTDDGGDVEFVKPNAPVKRAVKTNFRRTPSRVEWNPRRCSTPVKPIRRPVSEEDMPDPTEGHEHTEVNSIQGTHKKLHSISRKLILEDQDSTISSATTMESRLSRDGVNLNDGFVNSLVDDFDILSVCEEELQREALEMSIAETFNEDVEKIDLSFIQTPRKLSGNFSRKRVRQQAQCSVCRAGLGTKDAPVNSRTYNIIIETSGATCYLHRTLRNIERKFISDQRKDLFQMKRKSSRLLQTSPLESNKHTNNSTPNKVYDFKGSSSESQSNKISPANSWHPCSPSIADSDLTMTSVSRRTRKEYSQQEVTNLLHGVANIGKFWTQILHTYDFQPGRTSVDLKEKYARLQRDKRRGDSDAASSVRGEGGRRYQAFSMCEERRLRRGVARYGYNWKAILSNFKFSKSRTAETLRNRWRCMQKQAQRQRRSSEEG